MIAGPIDCTLRARIEIFSDKEQGLFMVAHEHRTAALHQVEAFTGIRTIANYVTETQHAFSALGLHVRQDGFERGQVAVDITDQPKDHAGLYLKDIWVSGKTALAGWTNGTRSSS